LASRVGFVKQPLQMGFDSVQRHTQFLCCQWQISAIKHQASQPRLSRGKVEQLRGLIKPSGIGLRIIECHQ